MISQPSLSVSTRDLEKPLVGELPLKPWLISYHPTNKAVLQRLLEPNLGSGVGVLADPVECVDSRVVRSTSSFETTLPNLTDRPVFPRRGFDAVCE